MQEGETSATWRLVTERSYIVTILFQIQPNPSPFHSTTIPSPPPINTHHTPRWHTFSNEVSTSLFSTSFQLEKSRRQGWR